MYTYAHPKRLTPLAVAVALALCIAFSAPAAFAKGGFQAGGGYTGPGPEIVTVEQAKTMSDDTHVALKGYIIQSLGDKNYVFKDDTGAINVEISKKRWQGQNIGPDDLVIIYGEVDKEWSKVEIEVKQIVKQ
jgi:TIGR00156 family protein